MRRHVPTASLMLTGLVLAIMALTVFPPRAHAQAGSAMPGNAQEGQRIAERWCAACHVVSPDQDRATAAAVPDFMTIARAGGDLVWLEGFLADPHPPMPDLSLTRREIRDLRAYFTDLRD